MDGFGFIFSVMFKLLALAALGFFLERKRFIKEENLAFLTDFLVKIAIPCLIFSEITRHFSFSLRPNWLIIVFWSLLIFAVGLFIGWLGSLVLDKKEVSQEIISLLSFQNSGYIPMSIVYFMFTEGIRDTFLIYIFIYLLGFNVLMWSVGSYFIFKKSQESFSVSSLFNMPVVATLIALVLVFLKINRVIPSFLMDSATAVGQTAFVFSMLILGAELSKAGFSNLNFERIKIISVVSFLKLIFVPLVFFLVLLIFRMKNLFGLFIIIEACMPSATSLVVVGRMKKADINFMSQSISVMNIISILTIPLWIKLFYSFVNL